MLQSLILTTIAYDYREPDSTLRYRVLRRAPKRFTIEDAAGRPLPDPIPDALALLYRLPELLTAPPGATVYIAEGEKDADALVARGLVATTMPCGTRMGWRSQYTPYFAGRHVVILPDADRPGRRHAEAVAEALRGVTASVVVVDLHERRRGPWDVTDWLGRGHAHEELESRVRAARYAAARLERAPTGIPAKLALVLASPLSTTEKLVLVAVASALMAPWDSGRVPPASRVAASCSLHRVTAQRTLTELRTRGFLRDVDRPPGCDRRTAIAWDLLAVSAAPRAAGVGAADGAPRASRSIRAGTGDFTPSTPR